MLRFESRLPWLTLLTLAVALIALGALAAVAVGGWPGEVRPTQFCEDAPGLIRQPSNTWSNLGFVLVGLTIAGCADRDRATGRGPRNPLTTTWVAPGLFALVTALLGPGSMAMHASNTTWGTKLDVASMMIWASAVVAYGVCRWLRAGSGALLAGASLLAAVTTLAYLKTGSGLPIFSGLLILAGLSEAPRLLGRGGLRVERGWIVAAVLAFGIALAAWVPSQTDGPLCDPSSRLQGHALWHVLCSLSAGLLYLHFRSEREA